MENSFIPKVELPEMINASKIDTFATPFRLAAVKTPSSDNVSFSEVMTNLVKTLDNEAKVPDKMMTEALVNPNVDIHDVMIAVNKSELTLNIATQITTKLIQGYEKIISMQV